MDISKEHINDLVQKTIDATTKELKRQGLLKNNQRTPFQKTETLLYNYPKYIEVINTKKEEIEEIETVGLSKKSKSIVKYANNGTKDLRGEYEKDMDLREAEIERLERTIKITDIHVNKIERALAGIEDDPYFDIIRMKYFEGMTREEIADEMFVDESTISRNKNRLVNLLQIRLFSDEMISDLMGYEL